MPVAAITSAAAVGGSLISANASKSAANKAAAATTDASNQQIQLQREAYDNANEILAPYSQAGSQASRLYNAAMGIYSPLPQDPKVKAEADQREQLGLAPGKTIDWNAYWNNVTGGKTLAQHASGDAAFRAFLSQARADGDKRSDAELHYIYGGKAGGGFAPVIDDPNYVAPPAAGTPEAAAQGDSLAKAQADYNSAFENSPYWKDAQYSTQQAMDAMRSTNAAMGRGSTINSGRALRGASDIQMGYRGQATQNYLSSLSGISGTGFQADSGRASGGANFANNASNALAQSAQGQATAAYARGQGTQNAISDLIGLGGFLAGQYGNRSQPASAQTSSFAPLSGQSGSGGFLSSIFKY